MQDTLSSRAALGLPAAFRPSASREQMYLAYKVRVYNVAHVRPRSKKRACLITLHSNFEIFQKGHPAVDIMLDRRIFER